ncbi:MAG: LysM peptidoglycan-binding domain-containing protein [Sulfurifustaceae bacterium]
MLPDNSIWARIRAGFRMPKMDTSFTQPHEQWFVENAEFREAMFERSKLYLYYIVEEVEKRGLPMEIALLPAIESAYKPYAYSRAKASGLWQFIASTGRLYGLKTNWWYDGRRDVIASTRAALDYLEKLHDDFDGDWQLALAAYNAGEGRIARAMEWNRRKGLPTDFASLKKLKPETRQYVPKLMAVVNMVTDPKRFGIQLPDVPNEPYFTTVETDSQVDLGVIARLTGMEVDALHFINPGYTRWATDPNGPHKILVPVNKKDALLAGLSNLPEHERVQWLHHEVRRGDTLSSIARHYGLTVAAIKASNKVDGPLRAGQDLLLPISSMAKIEPPAAPAKAKAIRASVKANQPMIHKVRAGETLSSIARRYNVLVQQLAEWNRMRPNDILTRGRRLRIWPSDGAQASSAILFASAYV